MAVISNIFIDSGADSTTTVTVTDSTGSAVNLSGYSHAAQIRKSYDSSSASEVAVVNATVAEDESYDLRI
jgi:Tfp pilus assembly protein PilV